MVFDLTLSFTESLSNLSEQYNQSKIECQKLNGTVEDIHLSLVPYYFECVGYDDEGYRFFWKKAEDGTYYKLKEVSRN
ncbi:MAG: hypothetical protein ACOC5T_05365 [Elusimicrobiota bacterium]